MPHLNTRHDTTRPAGNGFAGQALTFDAPPCHRAPPLPLRRPVPPAAPFPIDALGPELAAVARAIEARTLAPLALCGQAVLGAVAVAAQAHADVLLPDGRQRPLSLALLSVAASGERLDAVESWVLRAIRSHERQLHMVYGVEHKMFRIERAAWRGACSGADRSRAAWRGAYGDADRGRAAIRARIEAAGPEPQAPCTRAILASAPTLEGLLTMLADGQPSMGWFGDEPLTVTAGRGGSAVRRRLARALSGLWDEGTADRRHSRDGLLKLYGRRLSVHVATPPGEALAWLASNDPADQRLRGRLLCVMPDSTIGTRLLSDDTDARVAATAPALGRFDSRLAVLLQATRRADELDPRPLPLAPGAMRLWRRFNNAVEAGMRDGGALASLRPLGSLAAEHVARIAGVLTLYRDMHAAEIPIDAIAGAIRLVRHYLDEAARIAGMAGESAELRRAQDVLDHVNGLGRPVVHLAEIYQYGPASVRDAASARAALRLLEDHGHVEAIAGGAAVDGRHHRAAWRIVAEPPAAPAADTADGATAPDAATAPDGAAAAGSAKAAKTASPANPANAAKVAKAVDATEAVQAAKTAKAADAAKAAKAAEAADAARQGFVG